MLYQISVPCVIDRIYRVEASTPEEALALYHNGGRPDPLGGNILMTLTFEEDDSSTAHELEDVARVEEIG